MSDLYPEAFIGWKGLLADDAGNLFSPLGTRWPVGRWLVAKCQNNKAHKPPVEKCNCGIHATKTHEVLKKNRYHWGGPLGLSNPYLDPDHSERLWVLAEVALKGNIRDAPLGYRGAKACIQTVNVPGHLIPLGLVIQARYGVDLWLIDRWSGKRQIHRHYERSA